MLEIITSFFPYQLVLYRRQPVELRVKIKNAGNEKALVSYKIILPPELSLDRTGFVTVQETKAGELEPGKAVEERLTINARPLTHTGTTEIQIKATEHYNTYDFAMREYKKKVPLVVTG